MKATIFTGPPGCGKTRKTLLEMMNAGRYLYATSRIDLIEERVEDFSKFCNASSKTPIIRKYHSGTIRGAVPHEIEKAIDEYRWEHHAVVFITHEGLMNAKLHNLKNWKIIIDEVPTSVHTGLINASSSSAIFKDKYILNPLSGTQMSRVELSENAGSTRRMVHDDLANTLTNFDKRVKSSTGLYVDISSWDDLLTQKLSWISVWTLGELQTAESIILAGAGFEHSLLLKTTKILNPDMIFEFKKIDARNRVHRKIRIMYFTNMHRGSTTFWKTSEGRYCLTKVADHLTITDIDFWSANTNVAEHLEHRVKGNYVLPKQEGTNQLTRFSTCAFIYSAKSLPSDRILMDLFDISKDDILRAREGEDIIQFAGRGSLRSPESQETYTIYLYSIDQAKMLEEYLTKHLLGDVEIIPVHEADRERGGGAHEHVQAVDRRSPRPAGGLMPRNFDTQLAGQIGESLVVAELGRRGIVATAFSGNVPDIDLLAYRDGRTIALQVKSVRTGSVSFNAKRFMTIEFDGDRQIIADTVLALDVTLIFVFVSIGQRMGDDRFFILDQGTLQGIIHSNHSAWLAKHAGRRPRNPQSTHTAVSLTQLEPYRDNWNLIEERFK